MCTCRQQGPLALVLTSAHPRSCSAPLTLSMRKARASKQRVVDSSHDQRPDDLTITMFSGLLQENEHFGTTATGGARDSEARYSRCTHGKSDEQRFRNSAVGSTGNSASDLALARVSGGMQSLMSWKNSWYVRADCGRVGQTCIPSLRINKQSRGL